MPRGSDASRRHPGSGPASQVGRPAGALASGDRCSGLFDVCDKDGSGALEPQEFLAVLQALDRPGTKEDARRAFEQVGAEEALDREQLWRWCELALGELSDKEFGRTIDELRLIVGFSRANTPTRRGEPSESPSHGPVECVGLLIGPSEASGDEPESPPHTRGSEWRTRLTDQSCFIDTSDDGTPQWRGMREVREEAAKLSPYSSPVGSRATSPTRRAGGVRESSSAAVGTEDEGLEQQTPVKPMRLEYSDGSVETTKLPGEKPGEPLSPGSSEQPAISRDEPRSPSHTRGSGWRARMADQSCYSPAGQERAPNMWQVAELERPDGAGPLDPTGAAGAQPGLAGTGPEGRLNGDELAGEKLGELLVPGSSEQLEASGEEPESPPHTRGSEWRTRLTDQSCYIDTSDDGTPKWRGMREVREEAAKLSPYSSPVGSRAASPTRPRGGISAITEDPSVVIEGTEGPSSDQAAARMNEVEAKLRDESAARQAAEAELARLRSLLGEASTSASSSTLDPDESSVASARCWSPGKRAGRRWVKLKQEASSGLKVVEIKTAARKMNDSPAPAGAGPEVGAQPAVQRRKGKTWVSVSTLLAARTRTRTNTV